MEPAATFRVVVALGLLLAAGSGMPVRGQSGTAPASVTTAAWQGGVALAVLVRDETGKPLPGALLQLRMTEGAAPGEGPPLLQTDAEGRLEIERLAPGEWQADLRREGFMLYTAHIRLEVGRSPKVGFTSRQRTGSYWAPMEVSFFDVGARAPVVAGKTVSNQQAEKLQRQVDKDERKVAEQQAKLEQRERRRSERGDMARVVGPTEPEPMAGTAAETIPAQGPVVATTAVAASAEAPPAGARDSAAPVGTAAVEVVAPAPASEPRPVATEPPPATAATVAPEAVSAAETAEPESTAPETVVQAVAAPQTLLAQPPEAQTQAVIVASVPEPVPPPPRASAQPAAQPSSPPAPAPTPSVEPAEPPKAPVDSAEDAVGFEEPIVTAREQPAATSPAPEPQQVPEPSPAATPAPEVTLAEAMPAATPDILDPAPPVVATAPAASPVAEEREEDREEVDDEPVMEENELTAIIVQRSDPDPEPVPEPTPPEAIAVADLTPPPVASEPAPEPIADNKVGFANPRRFVRPSEREAAASAATASSGAPAATSAAASSPADHGTATTAAGPRLLTNPELRRAGACPECRAGEWSVMTEWTSAARGDAPVDICRSDIASRMNQVIEEIVSGLPSYATAFVGALIAENGNDVLRLLDEGAKARVDDLLAPIVDSEGACQVVGMVLPAGARYVGFRYQATDSRATGECPPGGECQLSQARWTATPLIRHSDTVTVVYGVFQNLSADRERTPRLTVYFDPAESWLPAN